MSAVSLLSDEAQSEKMDQMNWLLHVKKPKTSPDLYFSKKSDTCVQYWLYAENIMLLTDYPIHCNANLVSG